MFFRCWIWLSNLLGTERDQHVYVDHLTQQQCTAFWCSLVYANYRRMMILNVILWVFRLSHIARTMQGCWKVNNNSVSTVEDGVKLSYQGFWQASEDRVATVQELHNEQMNDLCLCLCWWVAWALVCVCVCASYHNAMFFRCQIELSNLHNSWRCSPLDIHYNVKRHVNSKDSSTFLFTINYVNY